MATSNQALKALFVVWQDLIRRRCHARLGTPERAELDLIYFRVLPTIIKIGDSHPDADLSELISLASTLLELREASMTKRDKSRGDPVCSPGKKKHGDAMENKSLKKLYDEWWKLENKVEGIKQRLEDKEDPPRDAAAMRERLANIASKAKAARDQYIAAGGELPSQLTRRVILTTAQQEQAETLRKKVNSILQQQRR